MVYHITVETCAPPLQKPLQLLALHIALRFRIGPGPRRPVLPFSPFGQVQQHLAQRWSWSTATTHWREPRARSCPAWSGGADEGGRAREGGKSRRGGEGRWGEGET